VGGFYRSLAIAGLCLLVPLAACQQSVEDRLEEVRALQELGAWEESAEELRGILEQSPDQPEANFLLGVAQIRQGRPSLAIWPLQMAQGHPEVSLEADLHLAQAYAQLAQLPLAVEAVDRVLAADPDDAALRERALLVRAQLHVQREALDEALADLERVLERNPGHPAALTSKANTLVEAGRLDEAEVLLGRLWNGDTEQETPLEVQRSAGVALARLYAEKREDPAAAERQLEVLLERHPADPQVVGTAVTFFDTHDERERADAVVRAAMEAEPTNLRLRTLAALRLAQDGEVEKGEALLVEGTELLGSSAAWLALERYREGVGDTAGALAAMRRVLELVPEVSDGLRFEYADLLIANGERAEAREVAQELGDSVYATVLRGALAFEERRYSEALATLDEALKRWPNNPGARLLAGRAAYAVGDVEAALSHLREAVRATMGNSDAGLDLARLHLARGEHALALAFAARTWAGSVGPNSDLERAREAMALRIQVLVEQRSFKEAREHLQTLAELPGGEPTATLLLASIRERVDGPGAAADLLNLMELDVSKSGHIEVLRAQVQYLVEAGRADAALERIEAAQAQRPDAAEIHDVHGRALALAARPEEARAAFERALELDPQHAPALEGLATLARDAGDAARARELFDRAAEADPTSAQYAYAAAQIALAAGDPSGAEERLREALRRDPAHLEASNDLAWILAERGERLDEALVLARRAAAWKPEATILDTLGWVQLRRGEAEEAAETFRRARDLAPDSPSIAYRLGLAMARTGQEDRARELLEEALAAGAFPEAAQAREQLARLGGEDS